MAWFILIIAGCLEAVWTVSMKYSDGFTKILPSVITFFVAWVSFYLLSIAMRNLPLSTVYPVWVSIGAVGAFIAGVYLFNESVNIWQVASIGLIVCGVAGLKAFS